MLVSHVISHSMSGSHRTGPHRIEEVKNTEVDNQQIKKNDEKLYTESARWRRLMKIGGDLNPAVEARG